MLIPILCLALFMTLMQSMKGYKMTITWGNIHIYLRMTINYSSLGKVKFYMVDYIVKILD